MDESIAEVHGSGRDNDGFGEEINLNHGDEDVTFSGATLQLNRSATDVNEVEIKDPEMKSEENNLKTLNNSHELESTNQSNKTCKDDQVGELPSTSQITRNRPFSASMISRTSLQTKTSSTASRASMSPKTKLNDYSCSKFFSLNDGTFDEKCSSAMDALIKEDLDGKVLGSWLLIEIDSWDKENERIFITTEKSLLIVTYDFIKKIVIWMKRINLRRIDKVQIGDLIYTKGSLNTPRQNGAIRLSWESTSEETSFGQRWNPFCTSMPYVIVSHHPVIYNERERESILYNVDDFIETTVQAIKDSYKSIAKVTLTKQGGNMQSADELVEIEAPIEIQSYAGLVASIYNQSYLGFNRDRNGVSF